MEKEKNKDRNKEKEESEREIISIDLDDSDSNESPNDNLTSQEENDTSSGSGGTATRSYDRVSRVIKDLTLKDHMKFMDNFDPELSNREKRKLSRKIYSDQGGRKSSTIYDEYGVISGLDKDACDCLNVSCPGCHFPCPKCRSCKCGQECRINRRWMYELIENEGERTVIKNSFLNLT